MRTIAHSRRLSSVNYRPFPQGSSTGRMCQGLPAQTRASNEAALHAAAQLALCRVLHEYPDMRACRTDLLLHLRPPDIVPHAERCACCPAASLRSIAPFL